MEAKIQKPAENLTAAQNQNTSPITNKKEKPSLEYQRDKDREMVRGVFRYYEVPGGCLGFCYKGYKGDQVEQYNLIDGVIYSLPLGVVKHLNKNVWYPVHVHSVTESGASSTLVGRKVKRCGFQSLEFIDTDDISEVGSSIYEVTTI